MLEDVYRFADPKKSIPVTYCTSNWTTYLLSVWHLKRFAIFQQNELKLEKVTRRQMSESVNANEHEKYRSLLSNTLLLELRKNLQNILLNSSLGLQQIKSHDLYNWFSIRCTPNVSQNSYPLRIHPKPHLIILNTELALTFICRRNS